jgi:CBS domain-containing protein
MLVKDCMTTKVVSVKPDMKISNAAKMMIDYRISGLPVTDDNNRVISMITKSDIVQLTLPSALKRTGSDNPTLIPDVNKYLARLNEVALKEVSLLMTKKHLHTARSDMTVSEAAVLMYANDIRRLPVVDDNGELIGIISYSDIAAIIAE